MTPPEETGFEMCQGYDAWQGAPQVSNLMAKLRLMFPDASDLELRNHVLQYTLVKLVVWLQPPIDGEDDKKEPWQ